MMIRKTSLVITIISLVTLIALGNTPRNAATNDLRAAIPAGEPQSSSPDSERSTRDQKQARQQTKKARKRSNEELPSGPWPVPAEVGEISTGSNAAPLRFADAHLKTGVRLRYAESGAAAGHPVILLHGYTDSWFSFSRALPYFDPSYHVFILDQRGHGDSERPASGYTFPDFAADVIAFMDAKGITRATLVGHSMGSFVAQQVALTAPERVERLVLIGSATTVRNGVVLEFQQAVEKLAEPVPAEFAREFQVSTVYQPLPDEFMDRAVAESRRLPARTWRAVLAGLLAGDCKTRLGNIRTPALILWGDRDKFFLRAEQDALIATLPNAVLKVYPETGHSPHWERPEQFAQDLKDFITRADAAAAPAPEGHHEAAAPAKPAAAMTGLVMRNSRER